MKNEKLGKPHCDTVRAAYYADSALLDYLRAHSAEKNIKFGPFKLKRTDDQHYKYSFEIKYTHESTDVILGLFNFDRFAEYRDENSEGRAMLMSLWIANKALYTVDYVDITHKLEDVFGLVFSHFIQLDIAVDIRYNIKNIVTRHYKSQVKDEKGRKRKILTIINAKAVTDPKEVIEGFYITYGVTLEKLVNPTLKVRQKKVKKNKAKGLSVKFYDKCAEIENASPNKRYITKFYDNPPSLHRTEVSIYSEHLRNYFCDRKITSSMDILKDEAVLKDIFYSYLRRVIRFVDSTTRKEILWSKILFPQG